QLVSHWTHPKLGTVQAFPGRDFSLGPAGMAFDASGYLVVATHDDFCVFSAPNQLFACHPKFMAEPTENVIFDTDGNLYTTTSTGGTNGVRVYDSKYNYIASHSLPEGSLTGVTCDPEGHLYIASQTPPDTSNIY